MENEEIVEGTIEGESEEKNSSKYIEMLDGIKTKISNSASVVMDGVVDNFVKLEIEKRIATGTKAMEELKALDKQIKGLAPDQEFYDGDGKVVQAHYTKAKSEELKKAKKRKKELDQALDLAYTGDFSKLNNLVK